MRSILLALMLLSASAQADDLFPERNPYSCIWNAKLSGLQEGIRRGQMADCMSTVRSPFFATKALNREGFPVPYYASTAIEMAERRGDYEKARRMLTTLIILGDLPPSSR